MSRLLAAALALSALALAGCNRLTPEQCEHICWRVNELGYWERFEEEARGSAPDARAALKAQWERRWTERRNKKDFDPGLDNCVRECRRAANPEDVPCVDQATTFAAAQACLQ